jgi:hypothetical protein
MTPRHTWVPPCGTAPQLGQFIDDWGIGIQFIGLVSKSDVVRQWFTDLEVENDSEDVAFYGSPGVRSRCAVGRTFLNFVVVITPRGGISSLMSAETGREQVG